jgi:hypothetical protein
MSRRGGMIWIEGHSYPCRLCGALVPPGEPILCLPVCPFPKWEPMTNFEGMLCHPACWASWQHRERFTELFNRHAGDAVLHPSGSVDYLGPSGAVAEHQDRVVVVRQRRAEPGAAADGGA